MGADRELYRIGVTPNCPVHQITVGGHCFPRRTEKVTGYGAQTKRNEIQGSIVLLEPGDIDRIKEAAKDRVIRSTRGKKLSAKVYSKSARNYRPQSRDLEVSDFLYIKKEETNPIDEQVYETIGGSKADDKPEASPEESVKSPKKAKPAKKAKSEAPAKLEVPELKKPSPKRRGGRVEE